MTRGEVAEAALRQVAGMSCGRPRWRIDGEDCRAAGRQAMGGTLPEAEQRSWWCPRCVAADAVENLPET